MLEPGTANRTKNSTEIRLLPGPCVVVLFYARWCVFSSQAAPHFNALPRFYPHIKAIAIDAMKHQRYNANKIVIFKIFPFWERKLLLKIIRLECQLC